MHDESQDGGKKLMGSGYILMRELAEFPKDRTESERDFLVFDLINFVSSGTIYQDKKKLVEQQISGIVERNLNVILNALTIYWMV